MLGKYFAAPVVHAILSIASLAVMACRAPTVPNVETVSSTSSVATPFRGAAFVIDVNTTRLSARVSPPVSGLPQGASSYGAITTGKSFVSNVSGAQRSILGSDAVDIAVSNLSRGAVGASVPGKVLLTFDLRIITKLNGVRLTTPSFPTPPLGVLGVQAFPFDLSVITSAGGVSGTGNQLTVKAPRFGDIMASADWDGAPHAFFNDADCAGGSTDCFRYEPFGDIAPLSTSAARRVGFLVDPTVGDIRVRVLVAADIRIQ